jgi:hypothetical protein
LVVYYDRPSIGTAMEFVYAYQAKKPIIVIDARPDRFAPVHPWIWYHATEIVSGIDQAINQLAELTR